MFYFLAFLATFALSIVLTALIRRIGLRFNLVSRPRKRDIHKKALPRIGGVAIFISFLFISLIYFIWVKPDLTFSANRWFGVDKHLVGIWLGGAIITFSMLLDDIRGLKVWQKLLFQILAVVAVVSSGIGIDTLPNPFGGRFDLNSVYIPVVTIKGVTYHFSLWSDLMTLVWMIGMMNVMNFVDGIDGLAAGLSTIAAFTIFILSVQISVSQPQIALIATIFAGATAGFLVWNFPPAKIFMGDSGSMFLGFMLGVLPLFSGGKLATVFLVLGFPIVDGLVVTGGRIMRGKNPFTTPDKTHLHHRFLRAGFSPKQALVFIYLIAIAFAWVALRSTTIEKIVAAGILILILFGVIFILRKFNMESSE